MSIRFHVAAPLAVLWLLLLFTRAPALTAKGNQHGGSMFEAEKRCVFSKLCLSNIILTYMSTSYGHVNHLYALKYFK